MIIKSLGFKVARFLGIGAKNSKSIGATTKVLQASSGAKNAVNGVPNKISSEELTRILEDYDHSNPFSSNFSYYLW